MTEVVINAADYAAAAAEIFVLGAICAILLVDLFLDDAKRWISFALTLVALVGAAVVTVNFAVDGRVTAFNGAFVSDPMGDVLKLFAYGTVGVALLYARESL
ncbi:MAG TPA: hypothetical protein VIL28_04960 [Steroidobacteraceae bacterium]